MEAQGRRGANSVPDPETGRLTRTPTMLTSDLALRVDPTYEKISRRFYEHPDEFALAFAKAWYKLLHRDMGPVTRYLGPWVPEPQLWQDPVPAVDHELVGEAEVQALKDAVLAAGLTVEQLAGRRGRRPRASAAPTSAAGPTAPASGSRRRRTGRSTPASPTCWACSSGSSRTSTAARAAARRSRSPT